MTARLCPQCWKERPLSWFRGVRKDYVTWCKLCRRDYKSGGPAPRRGSQRRGLEADAPLRVLLVERSLNRKHRGLPATITSASTCPPSCSFYGAGCYAEFHLLRAHWASVPERGLTWEEFCARVAAFPRGQLWRHNEAGDLPGVGDRLDVDALLRLAVANGFAGARGFTFTHKPLRSRRERVAVATAIGLGLTINLSADNLDHADKLAALGIAPVAVVLPSESLTFGLRIPKGRPIAVCPAQTHEATCAECQLCARPWRDGIVGFLAHGQAKRGVDQLVQLRRSA